jgi:ABC-type branched-subunit amino acid transport system permease subunit
MSVLQLLNGMTFAALLFVVASGFTLIFGLLRIVNLAHGALYLLGGYIGFSIAVRTGSFVLGGLGAMIAAAIIGFVLSEGLLPFVRGHELRQVLLTLGVAFVLDDIALVIWGGDSLTVPIPEIFRGGVRVFGTYYPTYRLFVLVAGCLIFVGLWLLIHRTRIGALIRAGVDDAEMVEASGINIRPIFLLTFLLGSALAGLGGLMGGAYLSLYPSADAEILVFSLAVVIIGGRGSLIGVAAGSLLVGLFNTFGQVMFPELAYFVIFGPMAMLLAFRPLGLFGRAPDMTATPPPIVLAGPVPRVNNPRRAAIAIAVVILLAAALPLGLSTYQTGLATEVLIFGILAMSIDILAGFAGRTSLGHGAIFGVSTYVVIYTSTQAGFPPMVAFVLGVLAATAVAAIFALLAVRTSGVYFLLLTLALGMIIWGICVRWTEVTGGENGLRGDIRPAILNVHRNFYWLVLAAAALASFAMWRFVRSPFGLTMRGIRDSESRMQSLGYNVPLHLFVGFTVSGFFAGIAGALYAYYNNFVSPSTVALAQSVEGLLMAIVGGIGTLFGAFVGAATIIVMRNTVSGYTERWPTALGIAFIVVMIFAPEGIIGTIRVALARRTWWK